LNLRGSDIDDTPVFLSHLLIGPTSAKLYTPLERFAKIDVSAMPFEVFPYEQISEDLAKLENTSLYLNPVRINMKLFGAIGKSVKVVEGREVSTDLKACKNSAELEGMRTAHILDGVALVNFLAMVKTGKYSFTEMSISEALANERALEKDCLGPSFNTIAGFADHGAVVHYSATPETDKEIKGSGLLVLDSGGQYTGGTTDITRTILFGRPTKEQIKDYTLVLKGHLALAAQIFPKGTNGHQLDILAHMFLWNNGMTYFHGTGHGVGFRLSVHEGPQRIAAHPAAAEVALEPGMVLSDEPGIYKEGKHGIRIENLIAVVPAMENEFGTFYTFETLTCCPYERALIDKELLTKDEVELVDTYHAWVYEKLCKLVNKETLDYLKEATKPL
jgi:Xaa-Pro aminopeptidase